MRIVSRLTWALIVGSGLIVVASAATPRIRAAIAAGQLRSDDPSVRKRGLAYIRDEREASATPAVLERLSQETQREMVELAGYTAMRTQEPRALPALQARADREGDSELKARLIQYASRLADRDYRLLDWLKAGADSSEPWRRAASCIGLLQIGRPEGAETLLATHASLPPEPRDFAFQELRRIVEPMATTIGVAIEWPADVLADAENLAWQRAGEFWRRHATRELLGDVLVRLDKRDPDWREVERLLHARQRVSRWIH